MIVGCDSCGARFEDTYRSTVCPHSAFPANDGNNVFTIHEDSYLERPSPQLPDWVMTSDDQAVNVATGHIIRRRSDGKWSPGGTADMYDADYFLRGKETGKSLYENYHWMPDLTIPMVEAIITHLGIEKVDTILDFGCARGYVVKAFRQLGYNAWGHDISQWALENADEEVKEYLIANESTLFANDFDWVIAKDVLEHIGSINATVDTLKCITRKGIFAVIPLAHGDRDREMVHYDVPEYEKDITHIHQRPLQWWVGQFHQAGWSVEGRYRVNGVKDNYSQYPTGNGFITARRLNEHS